MKIAGIILLVLGIPLTLVAVVAAANGLSTSFGGLVLIGLGVFFISKSNKKKEEEEKKRQWLEGNSNPKE